MDTKSIFPDMEVDENAPMYHPSTVFMPIFYEGKFITWPHYPFCEMTEEGGMVIGYKPHNVKWEMTIE